MHLPRVTACALLADRARSRLVLVRPAAAAPGLAIQLLAPFRHAARLGLKGRTATQPSPPRHILDGLNLSTVAVTLSSRQRLPRCWAFVAEKPPVGSRPSGARRTRRRRSLRLGWACRVVVESVRLSRARPR